MRHHRVDFAWYSLAIVVALIVIFAEITGNVGPISGPMLWTLFGVATSRLVVKGKWIHAQRETTEEVKDESKL